MVLHIGTKKVNNILAGGRIHKDYIEPIPFFIMKKENMQIVLVVAIIILAAAGYYHVFSDKPLFSASGCNKICAWMQAGGQGGSYGNYFVRCESSGCGLVCGGTLSNGQPAYAPGWNLCGEVTCQCGPYNTDINVKPWAKPNDQTSR